MSQWNDERTLGPQGQPPMPEQRWRLPSAASHQPPAHGQGHDSWRGEIVDAWRALRDGSPAQRLGVGVGAGCIALMLLCGCAGLLLAAWPGGPMAQQSERGAGAAVVTPSATARYAVTTAVITYTPRPTVIPTSTPCANPCNPWGYTFAGGNRIYNPPDTFCSYFNCLSSFWSGQGYVVECVDLRFSKSGGLTGVCSNHGGYYRTLYAPAGS